MLPARSSRGRSQAPRGRRPLGVAHLHTRTKRDATIISNERLRRRSSTATSGRRTLSPAFVFATQLWQFIIDALERSAEWLVFNLATSAPLVWPQESP
jgi:hypothetical protein